MVKNLESRITEAVDQLAIFDDLGKDQKRCIVKECFPSLREDRDYTYMNGILVNSSFGSYRSWKLINENKIQPLNCNILRNVLPRCDGLAQLPSQIDAYINYVVKLANPILSDKIFCLDGHTIRQKLWETDDLPLYKCGLVGE